MADAAPAELSSAPATEVEKSRAQPAGAVATRASAGAAGAPPPSLSPTAAHHTLSGGVGDGAGPASSAGDEAQLEAKARRAVDDEDAEDAADEAEDEAEEAAPSSEGADGVTAKGRKRGGVFNSLADVIAGTPDVVPEHDASAFTDKDDLKKIKSAIAHALVMAQNAQKRIAKDNSIYKTYIDTHANDKGADEGLVKARLAKVKDGFDKIVKCLTEDKVIFKQWDLAPDHKFKEESTFGYVRSAEAENNIYLGGAFWVARNKGFDSSAGTIVHELSHRLAGTKDHVYGQSGAKEKAENKPDEAAENADNWEYLAESA